MITKIVKLSSSTCGPCHQLKKELKDFTLVPVEEMDIDESTGAEDMCIRYNVRTIPTLLFFNENDECVDRLTGYITKKIIEEKLK